MASIWAELKRRNVVRVAIAYMIVAWLLIQIIATTFPMLRLPDWTGTFVTVLLFIGFPVALIFAWAFELTPEGIKKEKEVDRAESVSHLTGRKLDFAIIAVLSVAVIYFVSEKIFWSDDIVAVAPLEAVSAPIDEVTKTIAVLPFVNLSGDADQEYFSDGITEEILNALAGIRELAVTSRTSAFAFKGKGKSIPEIAQDLGVEHVLEGSVRKSGDQLRITAQLIEVASDRHLWSENYDRELTDIFAVQDEISAHIAEALKIRLLGHPGAQSTPRAVIPEAYDHYLRGLQQLANLGSDSSVQAENSFKQAITIDPSFVRAYAGLGWTYVHQTWAGAALASHAEIVPKIRELLQHGLEIDADNAGLIGLSAQLALLDGDPEQARIQFRRALALDPPHFDARLGYSAALSQLGRYSEAVQVRKDWVRSDPLNPTANMSVGFAYFFLGNADAALAAAARLKEIAPDNPAGYGISAATRIEIIGDLATALSDVEYSLKLDPYDFEAFGVAAMTYFSIGEMALADAAVEGGHRIAPDATFIKAAEAYGHLLRGDIKTARDISFDALADHRQFNRWWGGFLIMRYAVDELIDRGEPLQAVEMILQAAPEWAAFRDQSPSEAPHLSANRGRYGIEFLINYFGDFARALRDAGDTTGADNVLAHMEANLNWRREHGFLKMESRDAELYALQGREEEALDALERAEDLGTIYILWQYRLVHNRIFDDIRDHPRYTALVERVKAEMQRQRAEYRKNRVPDNQIPL